MFRSVVGNWCTVRAAECLESVTAYILNQAEHHKKFSYQEEIREIFKRPQGRLRRTLCLGLKHPRIGRPFSFRARRLMSLYPWLKHLGYSVRPLRGHRKKRVLSSSA